MTFCDAYDISYIYHSRPIGRLPVRCGNRIWRTTVEVWTNRPGMRLVALWTRGTSSNCSAVAQSSLDSSEFLFCKCRADSSFDSARRLSCVYDGPWKRAFRVNTRVAHFAVSHGHVRSVRLSGFCTTCFTLALLHIGCQGRPVVPHSGGRATPTSLLPLCPSIFLLYPPIITSPIKR